MPIVEPASFECMDLVPFQINPHYTDFFDPKHGGETRDDRLKEYIMVNPEAWVAAIREATALVLENGKLSLVGLDHETLKSKYEKVIDKDYFDMKVFHENMKNTKTYCIANDINFLMNI